MNVKEFRAQYPQYDDMSDEALADSLWAKHSSDYADLGEQGFKQKFLAGASQPSAPGGRPLTQGAASAPALIGQALSATGNEVKDFGRALVETPVNFAKDLVNIPRGLIADPVVQIAQNRPATKEEEGRTQGGLAGLLGLMAPGPVSKVLGKTPLPGRVVSAAAGAAGGLADAAVRSNGNPTQTAAGTAMGMGLGALLHGRAPAEAPEGLPRNTSAKVARSPVGPVVSSVTDRLRAMGEHGQAIDNMIEQVVQTSQREPGQYLQPFDKAVHAVTGRKAKLPQALRSEVVGALEGRIDPTKLSAQAAPLYEQMKGYFKGTVPRATEVGAMVKKGGKSIPFAEAAMENYYPRRALTMKQMKGDADARSALIQHLQDSGVSKSPEEARALLDDYVSLLESKGKQGGQLAIPVLRGFNPEMSPASLRFKLLNQRPALRTPASGLEHARELNTPFYEARPEVSFPAHVSDTERALAEIKHYGQDASNLTGTVAQLPGEQQAEAQHLIRTATESHEPWDPRLTGVLSGLRKAQLSLFTPITSVKNLSQRANTLLTSDTPSFLRRGMVSTKGAAEMGARSGARAEGAHETLAAALGEKPGFMERYLKGIGFTQAERGNRNTAAATGIDEAAKYAKRLGKNPADTFAQSRLAREGIPPETVEGGALNPRQQDQAGLMRSNKAQFRTHPKDLPDWFTSNPITRTAALFKSFDYQQTRLVLDETLGRLSSGLPGDKARGMRNLGILATVYPVIGEGVNDIYSVILRRESPAHVAQRTKEWADDTAKVATGRMSPLDYANKYKARYGEDILSGSAPGAGGTLVQTMQYGKGDKGAGLTKQAVGPAISRPFEAAQLSKDVLTQKDKKGNDKPMTSAQKREALKLIFGGAGSVAAPWFFPPKNAAGGGGSN